MDANDFLKQYKTNKQADLKQEYITVEECAKRLKFTELTIRKKLRSGEIKGEKFGRIWRIPV